MTEDDARRALLVRAFETAVPPQEAWTDEDRDWASRAAAEVEGERASTETFVARRARLAVERLAARDRGVQRLMRALTWRPWVGWALVLAALAAGVAADAIGAGQRINVLAPPVLALVAWNLVVYAATGLRALASLWGRPRQPGALARLLARAAHAGISPRGADAGGGPLARFAADWARASARLNATRVARILHLSAIAFALGALAGMYLRGLGLEYRAGWESTFLDAARVRALLGFALAPAAWLTGIALPDVARLEAIRFPASSGEQAATWIHLYAVTTGLAVVLPRLLLAAIARLRERRLATRFPMSLDDAYFSTLARAHSGEAASVLAVPFSHPLTPQAALGLRAMLGSAMGTQTRLIIAPTLDYGDEEAAAAALRPVQRPTLVVALMSATATPEPQAHGVFVDSLSAALPAGATMLVVVDESGFVARFGDTDPTASRRREERRTAWTRFLVPHGRRPLFVDLERTDAALAGHALREALDRSASPALAQATT
ncbi:MAG TPA: DUF2868 domain-containing protein [Zeimonas sp.]|nr:DUF2868 domain-containing protein [Zeimonas sp.]